jgi:hypothetical protein
LERLKILKSMNWLSKRKEMKPNDPNTHAYEQLKQSHDEWRMLAMHNYGVAKAAEGRERKLIDIMHIIAFESDDEKTQITARPIDEWHEDLGDVLWWTFPVNEPPYCGSPMDVDWPDYHTHWTPIVIPAVPAPKEGE